jgi:NADPH:quinone reductase-like Zn-dependent oxidoreductase
LTAEEAATVNLCALTAAQGIYYRLGLKPPFPWDGSGPSSTAEPFTFFIYGASTSVGMYAAQLVRRSAEASGTTVKLIGAASKGKFAMLRAEPYGFDDLVDYRDSDWPQQVQASAGVDGVHYAYDCISEGSTVELVSSTLREGGKMAIVRSKEGGAFRSQALTVEPIYGAVWEAFGVEVQYQNLVVSASLEARRFAVAFYRWLSGEAALVANPTRIMPGGLERIVPDGFALLGSGSMHDRSQEGDKTWMKPVSAEKLVYRM